MDRALTEQLVKKKTTKKDIFIQCGIVFLAVLALLILCVTGLVFVMLPLAAVLVVAAAILFLRRNVEYEYTLLEHDLTVDCIRNRSDRKLVVWSDVKTFDVFGPASHPMFSEWKKRVQAVHDACAEKDAPDAWFAVFPDQKGGGKNLLIFQPNERMLAALKKQVPRSVVLKEDSDGSH